MRRVIFGLVAGVLFGVGLLLSGMTQPAKVIGFLDVAGAWDPSLAFVMMGAIAVFSPAYAFIAKRAQSGITPPIDVMQQRNTDAALWIGAAIFGVGWGLGGFCPGPGVVAAGGGGSALVFVAGMLVGMAIYELYRAWRAPTA